VIDLLGLDLAIPDHSTLSRRAATPPVVRLSVGANPVYLLIDSTGLKLCGAGEWLVEKRGSARRRSWRKLYIGMDADTGQILVALLTPKEVDDASQVGTSLDQVDGPIAAPLETVRMTRIPSTPMSQPVNGTRRSLFHLARQRC
jgi:hypothetical protein